MVMVVPGESSPGRMTSAAEDEPYEVYEPTPDEEAEMWGTLPADEET